MQGVLLSGYSTSDGLKAIRCRTFSSFLWAYRTDFLSISMIVTTWWFCSTGNMILLLLKSREPCLILMMFLQRSIRAHFDEWTQTPVYFYHGRLTYTNSNLFTHYMIILLNFWSSGKLFLNFRCIEQLLHGFSDADRWCTFSSYFLRFLNGLFNWEPN